MNNEPVELAQKLRRSAIALAVATCFNTGAVWANPNKPVVVNGAASFAQSGNLFTVTNSPNAIINWGSFSIGANEITRFIQQSNASAVLNRVTGQDPSSILGALQSNGRVFLLNPNGIVFGAGSQIDVGGLVASTLNLSNTDFLAGRMRFTDGLGNSVLNQGNITTPQGGYVYLIGNAVTNNGIITSPQGEVVLAAGNSVELVNPGTPNLRVEITAPDNEAKNLGQIVADSGRIGIYAGLINHSGTINANSVEVDQSGQIILKATKNATLEATSATTANGPAGGSITVQSGDTTLVSGAVEALGSQGKGGTINVLGNLVGLTGSASVNASGETGGGTVLVGGDYQGKNTNIQNAFRTYVGPDASIKADAITNGDGGKVIVWADDVTRYYGSISARGGSQAGNGGFVETSGKAFLDASGSVNASAPAGAPGMWLLDPRNVTIGASTSGGAFGGGNPDIFTPTADDAIVNAASINTTLNSGTSVTITTGATGTQNGDITVASPLNWTVPFLLSPQSLTLTANRDINVNAGITGNFTTSNGSSGSINLNAGGKLTVASGNTVSLQGNDSGGGAFNVDIIGTANTFDIQGIIQAQNTGSGTGSASVSLHTTNGASTPSIVINSGQVLATSTSTALITLDATSGTAPNIAITNGTVTATGGALGGGFARVDMTGGSSFSIDNSSITSVTSAGSSGGTTETALNFAGTLDITNNSLVAATGFNRTGTGTGGAADVFILPTGGAGDVNINSGSAVRSTGGNAASAGGAQSGGQARINLSSNAAVNLASTGGSVLKTTGGNPAGSGTPLGGNSLITVTGATGIQVTGTGTATPAISAETTGTGTAQVTLTATTGGVTVSNAAISTGLSTAAVRSATTTILANGTGGFIDLNSSGFIGAFGNDVSTVSLTTAGSASIQGTLRAQGNARVLGAGNATVGINAGAAGITVQPGGVIDATGSTNSGVASGSGTVSLTSTGGTVLVDGSSITATGAANNTASGAGGGSLALNGASVTVRNGSTLLAQGGNDTSAGGGGASDMITATSGRADVDASSSVSATGGNSPGSGGAATVSVAGPAGITSGTLSATRGSGGTASAAGVSVTSSGGTVDINSNITVTPATGTGTITVNAGNAITRSAGVLKVVAPAGASSMINLMAANGIGTVGAPIQIFDGTAGVTATNGPGNGDIVLSQINGDLNANKYSFTNNVAGGTLDIEAQTASIVVNSNSSISNPNGPVVLRAASFIVTAPGSPSPGSIQAGSDVTLIANDMDLRGPVIANAGAGTIRLQTTTVGRTIDFGGPGGGSDLALDSTDVSQLNAANIIFGLAANPTQFSAGAFTTTGGQTYNGAVSLGVDTTLTSSSAGNITFNNTLQSPSIARSLTVNTAGATTFGGVVGGGGNPLANLITDAAGSTVINGGAITTTGNQTYNDAVTLGAATTLTGTNFSFGSTLNGAQVLTVNASGTTTFGGAVGGVTPLASLTTNATVLTVGAPITTTGPVTLTGSTGVNVNATITAGGNILLDASGAGANVAIAGNINKTSGADATLEVRAGNNITFSSGASAISTFGKLNVILNSDRDASGAGAIALGSGTFITSNGGDITLGGGANPLTTAALATVGDIAGVLISGAQLNSGTGSINIRGKGPIAAADNSGVRLDSGAVISTTSGGIIIVGTGTAGSIEEGRGIRLDGAGTRITSGSGTMSLTGTGGTSGLGLNNGVGVEITNGALMESTGTATINVIGTGGNGSGGDDIGIVVTDSGSKITSSNGVVNLTGTGGSATSGGGSRDYGIVVKNGAVVESTGTANVRLTGMGGNSVGIGDNHGIYVEDAGSVIRSTSGAVKLDGTGRGQGSNNMGVLMDGGALVESTAGGAVTIIGIGSNTATSLNDGVAIRGLGTQVASTSGIVTITGTGGVASTGVNFAGRVSVNTTSGAINITGQGQGGARGIWAENAGDIVTGQTIASSGGGDILLKSLGGVIELGAASGGVDLVSTASNVTFDSIAGATQNASGKIAAGGLRFLGSGTFTLDQAANDATTLAANLTGTTALTYRDANAVSIGTVLGTTGVNVSGPFTLNSAGAVNQTSPIVVSGVSTINAGTGTINLISGNDFQGPLALTGSNVAVNDINALQLGNSTVSGTLAVTSTGLIDQSAGSALNVVGTSSFNSGGNAITLANAGNDFVGAATLAGSNVSVNDANALAVVLNTTGSNTLSAGGSIGATGSFSNLSASATGAGAGVTASSSTNLTINSVSVNGGTVDLASTGGNLVLNGNISGAGTLATSASGTQTLSSGTISTTNYTLGGSGLTLAGGTLNVADTITVPGSTTLTGQSGALNANIANISGVLDPGGSTMNIVTTNVLASGLLKGVGTLAGNVNNDGIVAPGNSPGILNITGNYVQGPTGVLNIEIGGITAGTQYDQLQVGGTATLGGTLTTALINGYVPTAVDSFDILKSVGSTSGTFSTLNSPATTTLVANYLTNGVNLFVSTNAGTTIVGSILLPATELAPTGVLEQKDIFPSVDASQDVFKAAGDKPPPVCN